MQDRAPDQRQPLAALRRLGRAAAAARPVRGRGCRSTAFPRSRARTIRSPADLSSRAGGSPSMDGVAAADFDMIDVFIARHHLDLSGARGDGDPLGELARRLVDMHVPRTELTRLAHGLTPAKLAEVVAQLSAHRDRLRLFEDAGAQDAGQPGPRHQRQGRSAAARRRCRDRRRLRVRRDRDHHAGRPQCLVERGRLRGRRGGRPLGHAVPVLHRGGGGAADRHGRLLLLCRDGLGLRHREDLHRRRRHALVEGVPVGGLCLARHQDALHVGRRLGAADGLPRKASRCSTSKPAVSACSAAWACRARRTAASTARR